MAASHELAVPVVYGKLSGGFACERKITDVVAIEMDYYRAAAEILPLQLRRAGVRLAHRDAVILDELGYLPFSQDGAALLDRLTHYCDIIETSNESCRFKTRN